MRNCKETRPRGDVSRTVREALREGPQTREQVRKLAPSCDAGAIRKSLENMLASGAVEFDGERYALNPDIHTEEDYREFLRVVRRESVRVRGNPPPSFNALRAAQVGDVLRAAW